MQVIDFQDLPEADVTGTWGNINASLNTQNTSPFLHTSQCNHALIIPESLLHKSSESILSLERDGTQISVPSDEVQKLRCVGHPEGKSPCDVPLFLNETQTQGNDQGINLWFPGHILNLKYWSISHLSNYSLQSTWMTPWIKCTILSNIIQTFCSVCIGL